MKLEEQIKNALDFLKYGSVKVQVRDENPAMITLEMTFTIEDFLKIDFRKMMD